MQKRKEHQVSDEVLDEVEVVVDQEERERILAETDLILEDLDTLIAQQDAEAYRQKIRAWASRQSEPWKKNRAHTERSLIFNCDGEPLGFFTDQEVVTMTIPCGSC